MHAVNIDGTRYKLNERFTWEPMPDGCILYCQDSGQIMTLSPVVELILTYCDGETPIRTVFESVLQDAELSEESFCKTVDQLVSEKVLLSL